MAMRTTAVDAVGLEERAAALANRSIKRDAKLWGLDLAIRWMDRTTLEAERHGRQDRGDCAKAVRPDPLDPAVRRVAAVCVYPQLVPIALAQVGGHRGEGRERGGSFPSGLGAARRAAQGDRGGRASGAKDEIDIVLNRSLFLGGRYTEGFEELIAAREAAGAAHLKVILETGELGSYDRVRQAWMLAMAAGADFIKTSTGKIAVNATLPNALCMMEAARDFHRDTGRAGRNQGRRRRAHRRRGRSGTSSCSTRRSARLDESGAVPDRRIEALERRADADREGADRPVRGTGLFHDRLTLVVVRDDG